VALQWSSISFYETDPDEIRRHIDIVNALDEVGRDPMAALTDDSVIAHRPYVLICSCQPV